jgi:hypothetical protein
MLNSTTLNYITRAIESALFVIFCGAAVPPCLGHNISERRDFWATNADRINPRARHENWPLKDHTKANLLSRRSIDISGCRTGCQCDTTVSSAISGRTALQVKFAARLEAFRTEHRRSDWPREKLDK